MSINILHDQSQSPQSRSEYRGLENPYPLGGGSQKFRWRGVTSQAPCENCGRTKNCKRSDDTDLILCKEGGAKTPTFIERGTSKLGHLTMLAPASSGNPWTQEQQRERDQRRAAAALEEIKRRAGVMPPVDLDRHYRKILAGLSLNPIDRADLQHRGLSDAQIEAGGYKSIEWGQRLDRVYPAALPGIKQGDQLTLGGGYLCPCYTPEGLIVGFQMRARSGKYLWLSSEKIGGAGPQDRNGELPLSCWGFTGEKAPIVGLAEGVATKPQIVAIRAGIPVIGAAGGNWASSPIALRAALDRAVVPGGIVALYADGGSRFNPNVSGTYERAWKLVSGWGYQLRIVWYGQLTKADGDPDEVSIETLRNARHLTWSEFAAIGADRITARPGDTVVNSVRLSDAIDPKALFVPGCCRAIVSATGSGKTHTTDHAVGHVLTADPNAIAFQLVHRQILGRANAAESQRRIGHGSFLNDMAIEGIGAAGSALTQSIRNNERYTILCVDSLLRVIARARKAALNGLRIWLFIDELEAVIEHLLTSGTLQANGVAIRLAFQELLRLSLISGGGIIAADAYVTNEGRRFLETATGQTVDLILNKNPGRVSPVTWYEPQRNVDGGLRRVADQKLDHEALKKITELIAQGERVIVHSDNQKFLERLHRVLLEQFPGKRGERVDRKTSATLSTQHLLEDSDREIPMRGLDYLLGSPTMAEGVSIDIQWFTQRVLFATHLRADKQLQALKRDRNPLPTHVVCNRRSFSARSPRTKFEIKRAEEYLTNHTIAASGVLEIAGPDGVAALTGGSDWIATCEHVRRAIMARAEHEGIALGENLRTRLVADGWPVTVCHYHVDEADAERPLIDARETIYDEQAAMQAAKPIDGMTAETARRMLDSGSVTEDEAIACRKIVQADRFPALGQANFTADGTIEINETAPLLLNDPAFQRANFVKRGSLIPALTRLHHGLNPAVAQLVDRLSIGRSFHGRDIWCPDLTHATADVEIWNTIESSGILGAQNLTADSSEVSRLFSSLLSKSALIRAALGLTVAVSEDLNRTPYRQVSAVLRAYGVAPVCVGRGERGADGKRARLYSIPTIEELKGGPSGLILASLKLRSDRLVRDISNGNSLTDLADQLVKIHAGQAFQYGGMDLVCISAAGDRVLATLRGGPADDIFELVDPMADPTFGWGSKITLKQPRQPQPIAA